MRSDQPVPREVKACDTAALLRLEERADEFVLNQRLDPGWVREHAAPDGSHHLWPVGWNTVFGRPELPRQIRCRLLLTLRSGETLSSLLDVFPEEFAPLPRVTAREEGLRVSALLDSSPTVLQWWEGEARTGQDEPWARWRPTGPGEA
ncbi:hypothetical protein ABTY61_00870 [Kitasatospora sp. NPDC096128]|uniref:hypothetical protein n=1 Tax=Kitasatospora sp. NPDC096128 TaxID=3155547 RepID=UPI00331DE3A2